MAMMIIGAMCGCTAHESNNDVEPGCDMFKTQSGTTVKMYCIKHGSVRMQVGDKWIYVDPVTTAVKPVTDYTTLPQADYILVTHEHFDHLDSVAISQLSKQGTVFITNARCAEMRGSGDVMANGDTRAIRKDIQLDAVPAYNYSEGRTMFHPQGRDNGFILTIDGFRIYIAGDTEDIPEMAQIKDIDVAFLPVNQPYTMTVDQCVAAAQVIRPKVLIPYHFSQTDLSGLPDRLPGITVLLRQMQ